MAPRPTQRPLLSEKMCNDRLLLLLLAIASVLLCGCTFAGSFASEPSAFHHNSTNCSSSTSCKYEIAVYRATPGGIAAAMSAAKLGRHVLLVEPTAHVGGMATEGGIGLRDAKNDWLRSHPQNAQYQWGRRNAAFYGVDGVVWQPDHWVGEQSFLSLLKDAGVSVLLNHDIVEGTKGVHLDAQTPSHLQAILLENGTWIEAAYFIDASYEGEIMLATQVDSTFGRESAATYNETWGGITHFSAAQFPPHLNPIDQDGQLLKYVSYGENPEQVKGLGDDSLMAYSYRVCLTKDPHLSVPITPPLGYNPRDFELARRLIRANRKRNQTLRAPYLHLEYVGYDKLANATFPHETNQSFMKYDACCGISPVGVDAVGLAEGYATANRQKRQRIAKAHRYYVQGLLWFWRTDPVVPRKVRRFYRQYGLCGDSFLDNGHFPRQLYVREASRLVGDWVFSMNDRDHRCRRDSIAVGYWGFDIHDMKRIAFFRHGHWVLQNEGLRGDTHQGGVFPFDIPYWAILPKRKQLANLAVVSCPSASHVAFAAMRIESTLWTLGQAAGTGAAIAFESRIDSFHNVEIRKLQAALVAQGVVIHWPENRTCENTPLKNIE